MADHNSGHDPLDDRLRSTFAAERDAVEARRLSPTTTMRRRRSPLLWAPLAIAAGALAIAGFFFFGNRTSDQAVELDVAGQADNRTPEQDYVPDNPQSIPTAVALPAGPPGAIPYNTGFDFCFGRFDFEQDVAWGPGGAVPVAVVPMVGQEPPLSRTLPSGTIVTLLGGCTAAADVDDNAVMFVEVENRGSEPDWIRSDFLISSAELDRLLSSAVPLPANSPYKDLRCVLPQMSCYSPPLVASTADVASPNECGGTTIGALEPWFIWDIGTDDPDGGLIAHTSAGVDEPITRIIKLDEVVLVTGGCRFTPSGSPWYEIANAAGENDWVSARYLAQPQPACLTGEQYGSRGVPDIGSVEQLLGPVDGFMISKDSHVAFASQGSNRYLWFDETPAISNTPCVQDGPSGPACISGDISVIDEQSPEPIWTGNGPLSATVTGRKFTPLFANADADMIEITFLDDDLNRLIGLVNPTTVTIKYEPCLAVNAPTFDDDFASRPCAISGTTPNQSAGFAGSDDSAADHVHNLRVASNGTNCTRIVIELGTGLWEDIDEPANLVPVVNVTKGTMSTEIRFEACDPANDCPQFFHGASEPDRVDFTGGVAFVAMDKNFQPYVQILHTGGLSSVSLLDHPARLVVDISLSPTLDLRGPIAGDHAILDGPLVQDPQAPFLPANTPVRVNGWARPFEASGLWQVFAADPDGTLAGQIPTSVASGIMRTSGWAGGWGMFTVDVPGLPPGDYIAVFGEAPPIDDQTYWGTGQWFRVLEPGTRPPTNADYPTTIIKDLKVLGPILALD